VALTTTIVYLIGLTCQSFREVTATRLGFDSTGLFAVRLPVAATNSSATVDEAQAALAD
jgi:hypothetical protein